MSEKHCYIVSYDLCQPNRNYQDLYAALKSFPVWGRLTESTWAVVTDKTHAEIRDFLMKYIILSGKSAAWTKVLAPNEWVKNNLVL